MANKLIVYILYYHCLNILTLLICNNASFENENDSVCEYINSLV